MWKLEHSTIYDGMFPGIVPKYHHRRSLWEWLFEICWSKSGLSPAPGCLTRLCSITWANYLTSLPLLHPLLAVVLKCLSAFLQAFVHVSNWLRFMHHCWCCRLLPCASRWLFSPPSLSNLVIVFSSVWHLEYDLGWLWWLPAPVVEEINSHSCCGLDPLLPARAWSRGGLGEDGAAPLPWPCHAAGADVASRARHPPVPQLPPAGLRLDWNR